MDSTNGQHKSNIQLSYISKLLSKLDVLWRFITCTFDLTNMHPQRSLISLTFNIQLFAQNTHSNVFFPFIFSWRVMLWCRTVCNYQLKQTELHHSRKAWYYNLGLESQF